MRSPEAARFPTARGGFRLLLAPLRADHHRPMRTCPYCGSPATGYDTCQFCGRPLGRGPDPGGGHAGGERDALPTDGRPPVDPEVLEAVRQGQKLVAIQLCKRNGMGPREALDFVEELQRHLSASATPQQREEKPSYEKLPRQAPLWSASIARELRAFPLQHPDGRLVIPIMEGSDLPARQKEVVDLLQSGHGVAVLEGGWFKDYKPADFQQIFGLYFKRWACPQCGHGDPDFQCECGEVIPMHHTPTDACQDARCSHCGWQGVHPQWDSRPESLA